jgi:hypothetical protein
VVSFPATVRVTAAALCAVELELVSDRASRKPHEDLFAKYVENFYVIFVLMWFLSVTCMPPLLYE